MRTRNQIIDNTPGEACSVLDFEILRWYLSLQLEVLLDIRELLQREQRVIVSTLADQPQINSDD